MRRTAILYEPTPRENHLHFYRAQKKLIRNTLLCLIAALFLGIFGTFYAANTIGTCLDIFVFCGIFFILLHFFEQLSYHNDYVKYLQALLQFTRADDIPEMRGREFIHVHDDRRSETDAIGRATRFKKVIGYCITAVAWHPQLALIAIGSSNGMISIYDLSKGDVLEIEHAPGNAGAIRSVAWSPDGHWLATSGESQWICVWGVENGLLNIRSELYEKLLIGDKKITTCLGWSPDSQKLASISDDQKLRIWQPQDGECLYELDIPDAKEDSSSAVAWSPDGNFLAVASHKHTSLWKAESWQYTFLPQETEYVQCLAWSPDSSFLIGGTGSAKLLVWNTQAELVQQILTERNSAIAAVAFLLHGKLLVSRHSDGILQFRETESWQIRRETTAQESFPLLASFAFNADASLLAMPIMRGHLLRIWEVQPGLLLDHASEEHAEM